jgi:hypothetical protein
MPWWLWGIAAWVIVAIVVALWLGRAATIARERERAARMHRYRAAPDEEWHEAG